MIDWMGVATNSLWLLGLAVALAVFSYADWDAQHTRRRRCDVLGQVTFHLLLWSGLTLFCVGVALAMRGGRWWERLLWGVLAVMAAVEVWRAGRAVRGSH